MKMFLTGIAAAAVFSAGSAFAHECPKYWLDSDGELYNVNWNLRDAEGTKIATGVALKGLTQAEAEEYKIKMNKMFCTEETLREIMKTATMRRGKY